MAAPPVDVNLTAVVVSAIASMVIGFLWYGPLFGKMWIQLMGWGKMPRTQTAKMKNEMMKGYAIGFVGALVTAYVFAHFIAYVPALNAIEGAQTGFFIWLGFLVPLLAGSVLWDRKPVKLFYLNAGYQLVALAAMGAILTTL